MYPEILIKNIKIDSYLLLYFIAFVVVVLLLKLEFKRNNLPLYLLGILTIVVLIFGSAGSKIYYVIGNWEEFTQKPIEFFFESSGSGWYGGFILGTFSIILTLKILKFPVLKILDITAPVISIGQVIGRLGCFLAGCCQGIPTNVPWAVTFPNSLFPKSVKVHPTQIYEMIFF